MAMTPSQYKARYDQLKVLRRDGTTETVRLNQYRLMSMNYNAAAKDAWMRQFTARGLNTDMTLFTATGKVRVTAEQTTREAEFRQRTGLDVTMSMEREGETTVSRSAATWATLAAYCFFGKGAPEHYQMVLQLADQWGLAPDGLQRYADMALGLDCNGFVGNYLWHGLRGNLWNVPGHAQRQGADTTIDSFFPPQADLVRRWEDIDPSRTYIFGMINAANQIIAGGGGPAGHIVISEPGRVRPPVSAGNTMTSSGLWVVESTAGHAPGLWESWYTCIRNDPQTRTFQLRREDMMPGSQIVRFKIAQIR